MVPSNFSGAAKSAKPDSTRKTANPKSSQFANGTKKGFDDSVPECASVKFQNFPVHPRDTWRIVLTYISVVDEMPNRNASSALSSAPMHRFELTCETVPYAVCRQTQRYVERPTPQQLLQFTKISIAKPVQTKEDAVLPGLLLFCGDLSVLVTSIRPFLKSLPHPFQWFIEAPDLQRMPGKPTRAPDLNTLLAFADELKAKGNAAFTKRNSNAAAEAFKAALSRLAAAMCLEERVERDKEARNKMAICYANLSATYLLPGNAQSPTLAVREGNNAIDMDRSYAKGYFRLSRGYQVLGKSSKAQDVLAVALHSSALENDDLLVNALINLQTSGKGLSNTKQEYKEWLERILVNDTESSKRMKGLAGSWKKRVEEHKVKLMSMN